LAIRRAAVSVVVVSVIALQGEAFAVTADLVAKLADRTVGVFGSALGAAVAAGAGEAAVRAGEALLLLVVEVSGYIASGSIVVNRAGSIINSNTSPLIFVIVLDALASSESPAGKRLEVAGVTHSIDWQPMADTALTFLEIAWQALTLSVHPLAVFHAFTEGGVY
jgi:hypothetical protein